MHLPEIQIEVIQKHRTLALYHRTLESLAKEMGFDLIEDYHSHFATMLEGEADAIEREAMEDGGGPRLRVIKGDKP